MSNTKEPYRTMSCTRPVKERLREHLNKTGEKEFRLIDRIISRYLDGLMVDLSELDESRRTAIKALINSNGR